MTTKDHSLATAVLVVDLGDLPTCSPAPTGVLVAVGSAADIASPPAQPWVQHATFTLSEDAVADRRVITVESTAAAIAELTTRVEMWPQAATVCDDVLRAVDPDAPALAGVITESLGVLDAAVGRRSSRAGCAARTRHGAGPARPGGGRPRRRHAAHPVQPAARHNAFSNDARAALLEALDVARSTRRSTRWS